MQCTLCNRRIKIETFIRAKKQLISFSVRVRDTVTLVYWPEGDRRRELNDADIQSHGRQTSVRDIYGRREILQYSYYKVSNSTVMASYSIADCQSLYGIAIPVIILAHFFFYTHGTTLQFILQICRADRNYFFQRDIISS